MKIWLIISALLVLVGIAYYFSRPTYVVGPIHMRISLSKEDAAFLKNIKNDLKVSLHIKSKPDDFIYPLFNLLNYESIYPLSGEEFTITIEQLTTSRVIGSYFVPSWVRLDIYNSGIDQGEASRLTCIQKSSKNGIAVLDEAISAASLTSGSLLKDLTLDVSCSVNKL